MKVLYIKVFYYVYVRMDAFIKSSTRDNSVEDTTIIDDYRIDKSILGAGNFATVFKGTQISTGKKVAIKKIFFSKNFEHACVGTRVQPSQVERVAQEIDMMQHMSHPNIVTYFDVIKKPSSPVLKLPEHSLRSTFWYIIMEYCNRGTLENVIAYNKGRKAASMGESDIFFDLEKDTHYYLLQLKNALNYIRKLGYIHRDIKPQNILLTIVDDIESGIGTDFELNLLFDNMNIDDGNKSDLHKVFNYGADQKYILKLADFGLSKHVDTPEDMTATMCGTPYYIAPEILINNIYNSKVDLWSYGVIMYEMLFNKYPYEALNVNQLKAKMIALNVNFNINNSYSKSCLDLLTRLLNKDPEIRIDWADFFNHEWFSLWDTKNSAYDIRRGLPNKLISRSISQSVSQSVSPPPSIPLPRTPSNLSRMKLGSTPDRSDRSNGLGMTRYQHDRGKRDTKDYDQFSYPKINSANLGHSQSYSMPEPVSANKIVSPQIPNVVSQSPTQSTSPNIPLPRTRSSVSCPAKLSNLNSSTGGSLGALGPTGSSTGSLTQSGILRGQPKTFSPVIIDDYAQGNDSIEFVGPSRVRRSVLTELEDGPARVRRSVLTELEDGPIIPEKSLPITIKSGKTSYAKSAMSYIMSPVAYISTTFGGGSAQP